MNKYKFIKTICSLLLCICLVGCAMPGVTPDVYTPDESPEATATGEQQKGLSREEAVEAAAGYMKNMTVEEKAGQLFIVNLELLDQKNGNYYEWRRFTKRMKKSLDKYHIGGVILFSRNIAGRKQTEKLVTRLQENSSIPLFISVDEEGGDVARIANNKKMGTTVFQTMEEIGRTKDASYVYNMGETIGSEISSLGFNVDFAPVADVKTSELNLEIGTRSFGGEPDKVAEFTSAFVKGI